ncbi:hypothetical protein C7S20_09030 [Christiangramia fulva]|uniref:histidine kinase n=1 Tax=Christiangramia fulva TaxID=2126553 RepID=A0A2R3Z5B3_9FLAO|nr:sensor histidine kinase [Christiangramia fulva]AVR45402.1 hypothetical protein C7S20_09030 [Christiangramia fulva]
MKKDILKLLIIIASVLLLFSCNNAPEAPPFPETDLGYEQPVAKPFKMPESDTIHWETAKLKPLPEIKFEWDKLPTKPFEIGEAEPLEGEIETKPFYLDSLPSTPFDLEKLPEKQIKVKIVALGDPEIKEAGALVKLPGTNRGVMSTNFNFGLTGSPMNLMKDKEGMLWIGTTNGLARYDSENIEMYGSEQGLNITRLTGLMVDSKGRIWVANNERLMVLDLKKKLIFEIFNRFGETPIYGLMEDKEDRVWAGDIATGYSIIDFDKKSVKYLDESNEIKPPFLKPFQDKEGLIWLTSRSGVNIIDLKERKNYRLSGDYLKSPVYDINQGPSKRIWITNGTRISGINKKDHEIISLPPEKDTLQISALVYEDSRGIVWSVNLKGIAKKYSPDLSSFEKFIFDSSDEPKIYFPILEDREGQIWITALNGGLFRININNGRPGNFTMEDGLGANQVWSTLHTRDGKTWIGTYNGIDVYDRDKKEIKHFGAEIGLRNPRFPRLIEDSTGRIWATGNAQGVSIIDPKKESIQFLTHDQGLKTDTIGRIAKGSNGKMWIGGAKGVLMTVDVEGQETKFYGLKDIKDGFNYFVESDNENNIWVSWRDVGLQKIDIENDQSYFLTTSEGLASNNIYAIAFDKDNNAWISGEQGLQFLNRDQDSIYNFTTDQGLAANDVFDVAVNDGKTYAGTSKGFNILKKIKSSITGEDYWDVKTIDVKQGLNFLDVAQGSMSFDEKNRLWAGVENQILTVIDEVKDYTTAPRTYITSINITDKRKEFNTGGYLDQHRQDFDTIWNPDRESFTIVGNTEKGKDAQNEMEWKDLYGPYQLPSELRLTHDQNYLSFSYNSLNYDNPDEVSYRYFLEGIDKTWSPITFKTTSESYRDLPPGDYTFKVRSKGYNNIWSEPAEFSFSIIPPWWKTWWAYLLYGLVSIAILYSIMQYRSQWLKKENRVLEERVSERTAQLQKSIHDLENTQAQLIQSEKMASLGELTAGIAHEIQNPLNFVNNFSEVNSELIEELRNEKNKEEALRDKALEEELLTDISENEKKIRHHGQRADAIVKGMLQHSRNSSAEKELTDINKLADEYLRLSYHGLRAKDKTFNAGMKTEFDETLPKIYVAPQDIGRVILNLINNAFYAVTDKKRRTNDPGYEPTVIVSTRQNDKFIEIDIQDNGYGIPEEVKEKIFQPFFTTKPSGQGTGLGLSLSYDIVKMHGGILTVNTRHGVPVTNNGNSEPEGPEGTTFTIQLPKTLNGKTKKQKL